MNRKSLLVAIVACSLGCCLAVHAARWQHANSLSDKPRLVVGETERDLGRVAGGRVVQAEFVLRNDGKRRLIVREDVCSACNPAEWIIAPGGSQNLTIEFDVTGLHGGVRHVRRYTTSDPVLPRLALTVRAVVHEPPSRPIHHSTSD